MGKILCKLKDKCKNSIILNKFKKIDKNYFIIAFICLILIGPLLSYFSVNGHDTQFHFANTKILLNYLISRHFNLFDLKILGIAGNNLGYGIGIFYPRFAHSILAYLTVFTRNIEISFKVFQYCVTLLSGIFMYKLIKRISKNNNAALVGSIFYICAPYFVSDFYIRNAVAESLNFIFTPMIFLGIYDYLFLNNKRNFYIFFVVGFIGVINSHLVTGLFLVFAIIIFLILNIKKMFNIKVLLNFALASLLILLLSSPSLVLMIQHKLFGNVGVFMKDLMGNSSWAYGTALNISDYFSFTFNEKNNGITFYLNLIMVIMAFYAIINVKKINNKLSNKKILPQFIILAIIAFIVSTKLVPWYKFPSIFLLIQFPWRLQLFTVFFLSIVSSLLVIIWDENKISIYKPIIICATIYIALTSIDYSKINYLNTYDLSASSLGSQKEYLPVNTLNNIDYFYSRGDEIIIKNGDAQIEYLRNQVPFMDVNITVNSEATIELPRLYYFGYKITLENEKGLKEVKYYENEYGFIEIKLDESGYLKIDYVGTKLYRICKLLQIITITILFLVVIIMFFKRRGKKIMNSIKSKLKIIFNDRTKNNIKKNKFKILLILGFIITFPFLAPHFALDSYALLGDSYLNYSVHFLKSGRVVSALFYLVFNFIKLPYNSLSSISTILSVIILTFTIKEYISLIKTVSKDNSLLTNILIYLISFTTFYNFMNMESFIFLESFVMFLGIYFVVKSIKYFIKNNKKDTLISLVFLLLAISCYQGVLSIYIPITLLFVISSKENNLKIIIKKFLTSILFYGLSFLYSYIIIKIVSVFTRVVESKVNGIDIIFNIKLIPSLVKETFNSFFGLYSTKLFYLIIILLVFCLFKLKSDNKIKNMLYIFFIILCCLIFAYVPNIFMSSSNNYIAARMVISIGIIIPLISIYIIINYNYKLDKIVKYILIFVTFINFTYLGYNYLKNYKLGLETYRRDQDYILSITNKIREYESKNKIKIKNIYYGNDMAVYYHYNDGVSNGFNYCIQSVDWAFIGYLNYMLGKNCNFYPLDKNEVDELFGQVDYNNYDDKQLIFDGNTLYLLLY